MQSYWLFCAFHDKEFLADVYNRNKSVLSLHNLMFLNVIPWLFNCSVHANKLDWDVRHPPQKKQPYI